MNVLLVNISLDAKLGGGTAERTRHLAIHLARAGCSCTAIAITGNSWAGEFSEAGVASIITGAIGRRFPLPLVRPLQTWRAVRQADVVHIMGYWNMLSVITGFMARCAGTPYVLCPAGEFASVGSPRPIMRLFHVLVGKALIRGASAFIAITALESRRIAEVAACPPGKVWVIPNAVAVPGVPAPTGLAVAAGAAPGLLPPGPYVLFMGRLAPIKGPDLLLQAWLAEPSAQACALVFAGPDFGMQDALKRTARASGKAEQVHFIGYVGEDERSEVYRRALLLAVPSRSEAMSLVALEAGALGVPVLLTDACGFGEVEAAGGGRVVSADAEGLRQGLADLLARPQDLPAMGQALRRLVAGSYSWPAVTARLAARFRELVRPG